MTEFTANRERVVPDRSAGPRGLRSVALLVAGLPSAGVGALIAFAFGAPVVGVIAGLLIFFPVMFIVIGVPNTLFATFATIYHSTVWTLTYRELRLIDTGDLETELVQVKAEIEEQDLDLLDD